MEHGVQLQKSKHGHDKIMKFLNATLTINGQLLPSSRLTSQPSQQTHQHSLPSSDHPPQVHRYLSYELILGMGWRIRQASTLPPESWQVFLILAATYNTRQDMLFTQAQSIPRNYGQSITGRRGFLWSTSGTPVHHHWASCYHLWKLFANQNVCKSAVLPITFGAALRSVFQGLVA